MVALYPMTLKDLKPGERGRVIGLKQGNPSLISRMMALGIVPGEDIEVLRCAPLGDPMQIRAGSTYISVRRSDSDLIDISLQA
jgi:ferrous iron transport protein A